MSRNRLIVRAILLAAVVADVGLLYFGITAIIPTQGGFGIAWTVVLALATASAVVTLTERW